MCHRTSVWRAEWPGNPDLGWRLCAYTHSALSSRRPQRLPFPRAPCHCVCMERAEMQWRSREWGSVCCESPRRAALGLQPIWKCNHNFISSGRPPRSGHRGARDDSPHFFDACVKLLLTVDAGRLGLKFIILRNVCGCPEAWGWGEQTLACAATSLSFHSPGAEPTGCGRLPTRRRATCHIDAKTRCPQLSLKATAPLGLLLGRSEQRPAGLSPVGPVCLSSGVTSALALWP